MKKAKKLLLAMLSILTAGLCFLSVTGCADDIVSVPTDGDTQSESSSLSDTYSEGLEYTLSDDETYYIVSGHGSCEDTEIIIPAQYSGKPVKSIGTRAFRWCNNLTSVVIPDGVISIGSYAFYNRTGLTSVVIPNSLTSIASYAFRGCSSLSSITIPENVTSIGYSAFSGCSSLTEIKYNATEYTDLSSMNCGFDNAGQSGAGITVTIGANVKKIPAGLFDSSEIIAVVFEEGSVCESIGSYAFRICISLKSIEIPDSVTSIACGAFYYCGSLTSIVIPSSVTEIGFDAFTGCYNLTIYCEAESQPSGWDSNWNYSNRPVVWGYSAEN